MCFGIMSLVINIAKLKASLSEFMAMVKSGHEVLVTDRGKPVAKITAYTGSDAGQDDLVRSGLLRKGSGRIGSDFREMPYPSDSRSKARSALLKERSEGR